MSERERPAELFIVALAICQETKEALLQQHGHKRKKFLGFGEEVPDGYISLYDEVNWMFLSQTGRDDVIILYPWKHLATIREQGDGTLMNPFTTFYFVTELEKEEFRSLENEDRGLMIFPIYHLPENVPSTTRWLLGYAIDPFTAKAMPLQIEQQRQEVKND